MTEPSPSTPAAPSSQDTVAADRRRAAKVYLVGAGPGDAGLITLRGVACLQRAEVVLYDYLVNPEIVGHAPASAEVHCLGKHGRTRIWTQEEINRAMVDFASQGRTVVRLKGGDPAVFGRIAEETDYLRRHEIEFEIVPGVTAALAAGSYAGIPITHRDVASAVAFIAGREDADKTETALDFDALARFPGTLVFYMGVTTAPQWTQALLAAGKPADTPAAIVRRCSLPDQTTIVTTLGRLLDELVPATKLRPPLIVILGDVVRLQPLLNWFERRPLFGQRVLVTRPAEQASGLVEPLSQLGADVRVQPAIRIGPPADWAPVDSAIARLSEFDWVVFSSANGVRYLLDRLWSLGLDTRAFGDARLAVIGPGTAAELNRYQLRADCVPPEYRAESLASSLAADAAGKRYLLIRASRGREVLPQMIAEAGGDVEQVVAYQSDDVSTSDEDFASRLRAGKFDWVTVTSSAIARSLIAMFGDDLRASRLASISPITTQTLRDAGFEPAVEAKEYTMAGVAEAIAQAVAKQTTGSRAGS